MRLRRLFSILTLVTAAAIPQQPPAAITRMSVHNRLLLNRAAVGGLTDIEVLMLAYPAAVEALEDAVTHLDGRVGKTDLRVGYVRAELPLANVLKLVSNPLVQAWHFSTGSRKAWYRDGPPPSNAAMFRGFETLAAPRAQPSPQSGRPVLTRELAGQGGFTADGDSGLDQWRRRHPTFDGRGVTIAMVESGIPHFSHPAFDSARTLDGRDVSKFAGIINAMDADQPDGTRVSLDQDVRVGRSWTRAGNRTYIFPGPGVYRFGTFLLSAGGNLVQHFGVIEDASTREIRVDANGDGDFRTETPISDVNERLDIRELVTMPAPSGRLPFVMARGITPRTVHIYAGTGSHITMTSSVAAGSANSQSLAAGVAPGARILVVHADNRLRDYIEAYLEVAQRDDVDLINDSTGITLLPESGGDFVGRFMTRIGNAYGKLVVHSANNTQQFLHSASTPGDVLSIGGTVGPATLAALYGGALDELVVHPTGAAGPGIDGSIRPDILAPVHVIAADLTTNDNAIEVPARAPAWRLPAGYQISCCTSSSSPYAAGLAALLVSAAKQTELRYTRESLSRAIRFGARFLAGTPSYKQGHGVFDLNAAWRELHHPAAIPRIEATAEVIHPLAPYAAAGTTGVGILEREGWRAGMSARRVMRLRRTSGPAGDITYRVSWSGNDGTFSTLSSVNLPLDDSVVLPIDVTARTAGAHSALLNLHDPTGRMVFRTQATIVAAHDFDDRTRKLTLTGTLRAMREQTHYVRLPENISAMTVRLTVVRGPVKVSFVPSHGTYPSYYPHVHPAMSEQFGAGTYQITLARPLPGVWAISVMNESARRDGHVSGDDTSYAIDASVQQVSLHARRVDATSFVVGMHSQLAPVREPLLTYSIGSLASQRAEFLANGLPNQFPIEVPDETGLLSIRVRGGSDHRLEAHLYDCSSGECFSHAFTMPANTEQSLTVRRPAKGRWIAAVNAAPEAGVAGSFVIDTMLTDAPQSQPWGRPIDVGTLPPRATGSNRIILFELFDAAVLRDEREHAWERRPAIEKLSDRPVAVGSFIYR